jgi:hypothetical protein
MCDSARETADWTMRLLHSDHVHMNPNVHDTVHQITRCCYIYKNWYGI